MSSSRLSLLRVEARKLMAEGSVRDAMSRIVALFNEAGPGDLTGQDYYNRADCYFRLPRNEARYEHALLDLDTVIRLWEWFLPAHELRVRILMSLGQYDTALAILDFLLSRIETDDDDSVSRLHLRRGICYRHLRLFPEAIESLQISKRETPRKKRKAELYSTLGLCYLSQRFIRQAKECFDEAISRLDFPEDSEECRGVAYAGRGIIRLRERRWNDALRDLVAGLGEVKGEERGERGKMFESWMDPIGKFNVFLKMGECLFALGQFDSAVKEFRFAVNLWPDSARCFILAGAAAKANGEIQVALDYFNNAIKLAPNSIITYLRRSECLFSLRRFDLAISDLHVVLAERPRGHHYISRALAYQSLSPARHTEAFRDFSTALRDPRLSSDQLVTCRSDRARSAFVLKNFEEALSDLTSCIALKEARRVNCCNDVVLKGEVLVALANQIVDEEDADGEEKETRLRDADTTFARALEMMERGIGVKNIAAPLGRGQVNVALGQLRQAIEDFTVVMDWCLDENDDINLVRALELRAMCYLKRRDFESALRDFDVLLQRRPNHSSARLDSALCRIEMGDFESAIESLSHEIDIIPTEDSLTLSRAYALRGLALRKLKHLDRSLSDLRHATELDSSSSFAHLQLGCVHLQRGEPNVSNRCLSRAIDLDRESVEGAVVRSIVLERIGEPALEFEMAESWDHDGAYVRRGQMFLDLGELDRAEADFMRIAESGSEGMSIRANLLRRVRAEKSRVLEVGEIRGEFLAGIQSRSDDLESYRMEYVTKLQTTGNERQEASNQNRDLLARTRSRRRKILRRRRGHRRRRTDSFPPHQDDESSEDKFTSLLRRANSFLANPETASAAVNAFSSALELRPLDPECLLGRAKAFSILTELDLAHDDCTRSLRQAPSDEAEELLRSIRSRKDQVATLLGRANDLLSDPETASAAVDEYTAALELQQLNPDCLLGRAKAYAILNQWNLAQNDCTRSIRQVPSDEAEELLRSLPSRNVSEHVLRGRELLEARRPEDAIQAFSRALRVDSFDPDALIGRGVAYVVLNRFAQAYDDLELCVRYHPTNEEAKARLAWLSSIPVTIWAVLADPGDVIDRRMRLVDGDSQRIRHQVEAWVGEGAVIDVDVRSIRSAELRMQWYYAHKLLTHGVFTLEKRRRRLGRKFTIRLIFKETCADLGNLVSVWAIPRGYRGNDIEELRGPFMRKINSLPDGIRISSVVESTRGLFFNFRMVPPLFSKLKFLVRREQFLAGACLWTFEAQEPDHIIDHRTVFIDSLLGRGAAGAVRKGVIRNGLVPEIPVAVKRVILREPSSRGRSNEVTGGIDAAEREFRVQRQVHNHENIVQLYGCYVEEDLFCIVMERCEGGQINHWLQRRRDDGTLTRELKIRSARQLAEAMDYCHQRNIVHRDLKPANVMISSDNADGIVKVCDYGLGRHLHSEEDNLIGGYIPAGTPGYISKELLQGDLSQPVDYKKADVYAFGIMLWEIFAVEPAYADLRGLDGGFVNPGAVFGGSIMLNKIHREGRRPPLSACDNLIHGSMPERLKDLCQRCWNDVTTVRPDFQEILSDLRSLDTTFDPSSLRFERPSFVLDDEDPISAAGPSGATSSQPRRRKSLRRRRTRAGPTGSRCGGNDCAVAETEFEDDIVEMEEEGEQDPFILMSEGDNDDDDEEEEEEEEEDGELNPITNEADNYENDEEEEEGSEDLHRTRLTRNLSMFVPLRVFSFLIPSIISNS